MTSDANLIFKNTAVLAASGLLEKASTVCLAFFVARSLGADGLGIYAAAVVLFSLLSSAAELGSATFLVREISKDHHRTSVYLVHLGIVAALASVGLMGLAWLIIPHLGYSPALSAGVYAATSGAIPGALRIIQEGVFIAHRRVEWITYSTLMAGLIHLSLTLYLLRQGQEIVSIVTAFIAVQYLAALCQFYFIHHFVWRLQWGFSCTFAWQLLKESKAFIGTGLLACIFTRPEVLILSLLQKDVQIGFYSAALRIVDIWYIIPETYMKNVFPLLSRPQSARGREESRLILEKTTKFLLAIGMPLTVGIFVAAGPIVDLLYGPGFESSVPALRVLACSIPFGFLTRVFWRVLSARDQQSLVLRAQVVTTVARLAGGAVLIAWLASLGAAAATSLSLAAEGLLLALSVRRDGRQMGVFRLGWRVSVASLLMGVVAALLVDRTHLLIVILTAASLYIPTLLLLRAVSKDDFAVFRKAG